MYLPFYYCTQKHFCGHVFKEGKLITAEKLARTYSQNLQKSKIIWLSTDNTKCQKCGRFAYQQCLPVFRKCDKTIWYCLKQRQF